MCIRMELVLLCQPWIQLSGATMSLNMSVLVDISNAGALLNSSCTAASTPRSEKGFGVRLENRSSAIAFRSAYFCTCVVHSCVHGSWAGQKLVLAMRQASRISPSFQTCVTLTALATLSRRLSILHHHSGLHVKMGIVMGFHRRTSPSSA